MNAKKYFNEVVRPMARELERRPNEIPIVMASAIVTYHTCDWILEERSEQSISAVRRRIADRYPDFRYLEAVANCHKHSRISRKNSLDRDGEFNDLKNPLKPEEVFTLVTETGSVLTTETGSALVLPAGPAEYLFFDGEVRKTPIELVLGAVEALSKEFD